MINTGSRGSISGEGRYWQHPSMSGLVVILAVQ
jgi:hypothetical protein